MIQFPELVRALVVAVDNYDDTANIGKLASPVRDAVAIVGWLRQLGVPWDQITLHVAEKSSYLPTLEAMAKKQKEVRLVGNATRAAIVDSIAELMLPSSTTTTQRSDGADQDRVLVFLLGHGYQLRANGDIGSRVFLTQEYRPGLRRNISVEHLAEKLKNVPGLRQAVIVYDACSNQPYGNEERARINPDVLSDVEIDAPNPRAGVAVCSGSGQLELAQEGSKTSVFMASLLGQLRPDNLRDEFIDFDGRQPFLDLRALMLDPELGVRRLVQDATGKEQNPELDAKGANTANSAIPLFVLALELEPEKFLRLKAQRNANRRDWLAVALDYRERVTRLRSLVYRVDRFAEAADFFASLPEDHPARGLLVAALAVAEQDLRSETQALTGAAWDAADVKGDPESDGRDAYEGAWRHADLSRAASGGMAPGEAGPIEDPMWLVTAAGKYADGTDAYRRLAETVYANAVWEALRGVAPVVPRLQPEVAVQLLGWWVALADARGCRPPPTGS